jgi:hypothetical protein
MHTFVDDQGLHSLPTISNLLKFRLTKDLTRQSFPRFLTKADPRP